MTINLKVERDLVDKYVYITNSEGRKLILDTYGVFTRAFKDKEALLELKINNNIYFVKREQFTQQLQRLIPAEFVQNILRSMNNSTETVSIINKTANEFISSNTTNVINNTFQTSLSSTIKSFSEAYKSAYPAEQKLLISSLQSKLTHFFENSFKEDVSFESVKTIYEIEEFIKNCDHSNKLDQLVFKWRKTHLSSLDSRIHLQILKQPTTSIDLINIYIYLSSQTGLESTKELFDHITSDLTFRVDALAQNNKFFFSIREINETLELNNMLELFSNAHLNHEIKDPQRNLQVLDLHARLKSVINKVLINQNISSNIKNVLDSSYKTSLSSTIKNFRDAYQSASAEEQKMLVSHLQSKFDGFLADTSNKDLAFADVKIVHEIEEFIKNSDLSNPLDQLVVNWGKNHLAAFNSRIELQISNQPVSPDLIKIYNYLTSLRGFEKTKALYDRISSEVTSRIGLIVQAKKPYFTENEMNKVFELKYMLDLFTKSHLNPEIKNMQVNPQAIKLQNRLNSAINKILVNVKKYIRLHPASLPNQVAATIGDAATTGISTLREINISKLKKTNSVNTVYLIPEHQTVYKLHETSGTANLRSQEDEKNIQQLLALQMAPDHISSAFVPSFTLQDMNIDRFGVESKQPISKSMLVDTKKYVPNMIMGAQLDASALAFIFSRLDKYAGFDMALTGELQLEDLHGNNIGFSPNLSEASLKFANTKFVISMGGKPHNASFVQLFFLYVYKQIKDGDEIQIADASDNIIKTAHIENILGLKEALNEALSCQWKMSFIDTDLSLGESNGITFRKYGAEPASVAIPLRSFFLEHHIRNLPFSKESLERLYNSDKRDANTKEWISRMDAPIRKRFSEEAQTRIDEHFARILQQPIYSTSHYRATHGFQYPYKYVQKRFIDDISNINIPQNLEFWRLVESELKSDVTSSSEAAVSRRRSIALQLMPRLSWRQRDAHLERIQSRKEYLENYKALSNFKGGDFAKKQLIQKVLNSKSLPITSVEKEDLKNDLKAILDKPLANLDSLELLRQRLILKLEPNYFRLMCAMYPNLADAYRFHELHPITFAYPDGTQETVRPGETIGHPEIDLKACIDDGLKNLKPDSEAFKLATALKEALIAAQKDKVFL